LACCSRCQSSSSSELAPPLSANRQSPPLSARIAESRTPSLSPPRSALVGGLRTITLI
jgi:hypothetical protein